MSDWEEDDQPNSVSFQDYCDPVVPNNVYQKMESYSEWSCYCASVEPCQTLLIIIISSVISSGCACVFIVIFVYVSVTLCSLDVSGLHCTLFSDL